MNRVLTDKGVTYTYNAAGERKTAVSTSWATTKVWDENAPGQPYGTMGAWVDYWYEDTRREDYIYDGAGRLETVKIARSTVL